MKKNSTNQSVPEHDLLLPVTSLQWVCYKPQFPRQKCKDAALHACGSERTKRNQCDFQQLYSELAQRAGAVDYRLDVATDSSFINYVPGYQNLDVGNVLNSPVTGLSAHTTYYYRVRTYNGCATSANSSVKNVLTSPCVPAAPSAQNATNVTASSFTAHWRSVSGAIDYRLDVATDSSFITYVPGYQDLSVGNMTSFPVTGLSAHTTYYYRVRAYNGCATSSNSSVKSVQT